MHAMLHIRDALRALLGLPPLAQWRGIVWHDESYASIPLTAHQHPRNSDGTPSP